MKPATNIIAAILLCTGLGACASWTTEQKGTALGAAAGAVVGGVVTGGSALGTVGGAAVGGFIGNGVG